LPHEQFLIAGDSNALLQTSYQCSSKEEVMKRVIIAGAIVLASVLNAHAGQMVYKWYDTIRPNGHKRPDVVSNANLATCNAQFGEQTDGLSPGFKACMESQGYRLISARMRGVAAGTVIYNRDSRDPGVGWHTENGFRVCHNDCDNPEIPGSGATCSNVTVIGTPMRQCVTHN
jgi:hypothetical protein